MIPAMRRLSAIFALLAAGCGSAASVPPEPASDAIAARFPPGGAQDVIEVTMRDRVGARAATLVAPGGAETPAYRLSVQPARASPRAYGAIPAATPGGFTVPGSPSVSAVDDAILTTAWLRVPDLIDYRRNWQAYRIRLELGSGAAARRAVTVRAPPPG